MGFRGQFAQADWVTHIRFGSKADIGAGSGNVRFTPKSGHHRVRLECPLCAKSGHEGDLLNLGVTRRNGRGVVMGTQVIGVV